MLNSLQLKQYQNTYLLHILSSQFVYSCLNEKCEIKKQELIIENKKNKKIYYLYLFLTAKKALCQTTTYRFQKIWKKNVSQTKSQIYYMKSWSQKMSFFRNFLQMLFQMIRFSNKFRKKNFKIKWKEFKFNYSLCTLNSTTVGLKSKNSYISDIRLIWKLKWTKKTSIFQKIFF